MKMQLTLYTLLLCALSLSAQIDKEILQKGNTSSSSEAEYLKQYNKNIKKSKIDGIYIPTDLHDAFSELIFLSPPEAIEKFKNGKEDVVARKLHYGLGKWMIQKWQFENGSRFSHFLKSKGVSFPDDMAQVVLRTFHRHLNKLPLEVETLTASYAEKRKKEHEMRKANRKVIKTETKLRPKEK